MHACLTSPQGQVESCRTSQGREYYGEVGIGGFFPEVKCEAGQYLTLIIIFFQMYVQVLKTNTFVMGKKTTSVDFRCLNISEGPLFKITKDFSFITECSYKCQVI